MRTDTSLHLVAIAIAFILSQIGDIMIHLPMAIRALVLSFSGILLLIGILGLFGVWNKLFHKNSKTIPTPIISPIEQIKHDKRPSTILSLFWVLFFCLLLAGGVWQVYLWWIGKIPIHLNLSTILFPFAFLLFPIYALVDIFVIRRKYYRLDKSSLVKDADFILDGNTNNIFDNCRRILLEMNITKLKRKSPNLLKAQLGKSRIVVKITQRKDLKVNIYIFSDVIWWIERHDYGSNQKNIDTFTKLLYSSTYRS